MQWVNVTPNFSGSSQSMSNAVHSLASVGHVANEFMENLRADQREKNRVQEHADEMTYRKGRDATLDAQHQQLFGIQQATANRDAEKFGIDKATTMAQNLANTYLDANRSDVVTPDQAQAIAAAFNKNHNVDVVGLMNAATKKYNASPEMQRAQLGSVNINQGPIEVQTGTDAYGNPITQSVTPDMSKVQHNKDDMLAGLDRQIESNSDRAFRAKQLQEQLAAQLNLEGLRFNHDKALQALKDKQDANKFEPRDVFMTSKEGTVAKRVYSQKELDDAKAQKYTEGKLLAPVIKSGVTDSIVKAAMNNKTFDNFDSFGTGDRDKAIRVSAKVKELFPDIPDNTILDSVYAAGTSGFTKDVTANSMKPYINKFVSEHNEKHPTDTLTTKTVLESLGL